MLYIKKRYLIISLSKFAYIMIFILFSCNNTDGLFGHSKTKKEAKENGQIVEYLPNKVTFHLLDQTKMQIDTAWAEIIFTNKNGVRVPDSSLGYNFAIPYKRDDSEKFSFTFALADTTNREFANGREENICQLYPKVLKDRLDVLLKQKNPDTSFGWKSPIVTDTIIFTKIK